MISGWYGDDFTGATDTLATWAQAGRRAMLFLGVPSPDRLQGLELDAIGIAGATRAMDPAAMARELDPAGAFLAAAGCRILHYKVCSTFDSAPQVGNIATAIEVLRRHVAHPMVAILGGQPGLGRYCAFSHLFASAGPGGAIERIDRHPTMRDHPSTPMRESDLRRHLASLGLQGVAGIHLPVHANGAKALEDAWQTQRAAGAPAALFDVTESSQLPAIGALLLRESQEGPMLAVGASSIAQALVTSAASSATTLAPSSTPVFVFAGSLSPVTRRQIDAAASYERIALSLHDLQASESGDASTRIDRALAAGRHVLAYTPRDLDTSTLSTREVAEASACFVRRVLKRRASKGQPLRRVGIAGGDTSSFVAQSLGFWALGYAASLGQGVTVSRGYSDDPFIDGLEMMLKGGQMGSVEVFEQLL